MMKRERDPCYCVLFSNNEKEETFWVRLENTRERVERRSSNVKKTFERERVFSSSFSEGIAIFPNYLQPLGQKIKECAHSSVLHAATLASLNPKGTLSLQLLHKRN